MTTPIRILYAEDSAQDADLTRMRFAEFGDEFALEIVHSGEHCLERLADGVFDALLLDQRLPDMEGLEVLRALVHRGAQLPVVLVTGRSDEDLVVRALRLGAVDYVPKSPGYLESLPEVMRAAAREHQRRVGQGFLTVLAPRRILYVEHLPMDIELTLRHFAESAPHLVVDVVNSSAEALVRLTNSHAYDLALVDLRMPGMGGLELIREARHRGLDLPPFVMVTGKGDDAAAIATLRMGATDYVVKRDGYLDQLSYTIDHAIDFDRVRRLSTRLQAELAERERREGALREAEQRLRLALEGGRVALWDRNLGSSLVEYSPEWKRQLGFAEGEVGDSFDEWQQRVHPADAAEALHRVDECLAGRTPSYEQVIRFRHKDGTYRHMLARGSVMRNASGAPTRLVASHIDITEQVELREQLMQAQKIEGLGRLAGGVAHDFNNLLTIIISIADLAAEGLDSKHPVRADIDEIRRTGERAAAITQQLLAFSRRQILQPTVLDLNHVVTDMGKMLSRLLGEHIALEFRLDADLGNVKADRAQIAQVILNLAVNARDAMPSGGTLTTETRNVALDAVYAAAHPSVVPGPYVMLSMSDTGIGMDQATQARLFEPFFTTKSPDQGTGLGLSTVYGVVKQSGGSIWVYSEPGHGSVFKVYLPRVEQEAEAVVVKRPQSAPRGHETILLVEDDEALRTVATRILRSAGYSVLAASSGAEALRLLEPLDQRIDLLLTDVVLPGMNGPALAAMVAERLPRIKVLYSSGYTDDAILRLGVSEATLSFIGKPYSVGALKTKVRQVLDAAVGDA